MADNIINAKIQEAYDTEANWTQNNPVLLAGQVAFSSDKYGYFKVGDGTKQWNQLDYHLYTETQRLKTNGVFYKTQNVATISPVDISANMETIVTMVLNALPDADIARY